MKNFAETIKDLKNKLKDLEKNSANPDAGWYVKSVLASVSRMEKCGDFNKTYHRILWNEINDTEHLGEIGAIGCKMLLAATGE